MDTSTPAENLDYYMFWNYRIIEVRFEMNRGYVNILDSYAAGEGRREKGKRKSRQICQLQEMTDKIIKNDYLLFMGDLNVIIGNQRLWKTKRNE
jgi:exonuclease III